MLEEIYVETSASFLSKNLQKIYKIISYPEGSLISNYDYMLMTMKIGEEAWIKFPYMYHSVSEASWDTIWYHFVIESADFTPDLLSLPQFMPFLREHKVVKGSEVVKRVVEEGTGNSANVTAKLVYNYEIVLENGCVVESMMAKNYLLTRNISPGMHSGIHLSLYTMRVREKSFIRLPPGYHALDKFSTNTLWAHVFIENIIFPNDLIFPQTLPYLEEIDLKDNSVVKRIVKKGSGPKMQGMIKVWTILEGRLEDGYHFQKPKEEVVILNGGKIYSEALIVGINSMQRGEISWIKAPPDYHIYKDGYENETLWMLVNVKEYFESFPKLNSKMTIDEKLDEGFKQLEIAKRLFSSNTKRECKTIYNDIITILKLKKDGFAELTEANKTKFIDVKGRAMMNLALMFIKDAEDSDKEDVKIKTLQRVFDMCNELLIYDKSSIKAYYRRGTAFFVKKMLTEAQEDFSKVLELDSQNPDAKRYLQIIKKETKKSGLKEKKIYKGIFTDSRWAEETIKDEVHQIENEAKLANDTEIWRKEIAEKEQQAQLRHEEYKKTLEDLEKGIVIDTADVSDPVTDMLLLDS